jgi:DNA helicase HerA-like ATPase
VNRKRFTVVCGVSESGKTTFAVRYLLNERGLARRYILDPDGEMSERLRLPLARRPCELDQGAFDGWLCFDPSEMFSGRPEAALRFFCDWSFAVNAKLGGRGVLVIDEVWRYCSPNSVPPELANVFQTGRKAGLEGMFLTQRPNRLNGTVWNEATEIVSFRIKEAAGLDVLEKNGLPAEQVRALPPGTFLAVNDQSDAPFRGQVFPPPPVL